MTPTLPASGPANVVSSPGAQYSPDQSAGAGQAGFARELQDFGQSAAFGIISHAIAPHAAIEIEPLAEKKEPGEPSATCLAVVPFMPLPQQTPPITLELSLDKGAKESISIVSDGKTTGTGEAAPKATGLPEMLAQPTSGELAVAVRLKAQNAQTPAATGGGAKVVPVREPRRVDVDAAPPVQPVGESVFQAAAWNGHEAPASAGSHASLENSSAPPEHLDAAPAYMERPARAAEPLRNLSIQLGQPNQEKVELRVTERAGEVRVAVRTADVELQNGLRQSLPELVNRLEGQGYRADAWRPSGVVSAATPVGEARQSSPDYQSGDQQPQQGWSQQERGQHNHNHSQRPQWVEELEGNQGGDGNRPPGAFNGYIR